MGYPNNERENAICILDHVCDARGKKKRRKGEDGREGEGGRGLLKSQLEEWLKSLHIMSGVWRAFANKFVCFFIFKERGLTLRNRGKIHLCEGITSHAQI